MIKRKSLLNTETSTNKLDSIFYTGAYATFVLLMFYFYKIFSIYPLAILGCFLMFASVFVFKFANLFILALMLAPSVMVIKIGESEAAIFGFFLVFVELKYFASNRLIFAPIVIIHFFLTLVTTILYTDMTLFMMIVRSVLFFSFVLSLYHRENEYTKAEYKDKMIRAFSYGMLLYACLQFFYEETGRNYYSASMPAVVAILMLYIMHKKKHKVLYIMMILLISFCTALSTSRTAFIALCCTLLTLVFSLFQKGKQGAIFALLLLLVIALLIFSEEVELVLEAMSKRFQEENISTASGRTTAWEKYLKMAFSTVPRMLIGSGDTGWYIDRGIMSIAEHNTFVQSIFAVGLLGTITLLGIFISIYKKVTLRATGKNRLSFYVPTLCTCVCYFGISGLYSDQFNITVFMTFVTMSYCRQLSFENNKGNNEEVIN